MLPQSIQEKYPCPGMSSRKVHFSVPIHQIEYLDKQWDEVASQLARDGSTWLRMGADRQRFRDRIERTADVLNRILDLELREKIYRERFEKFVIPEQPRETQNNTINLCELVGQLRIDKPSDLGEKKDCGSEGSATTADQIQVKTQKASHNRKANTHTRKRRRRRYKKGRTRGGDH